MKQKINLLIGFSSVVLVALIAMQYYLVKTSYDYKVEQFHIEVKEKISKITNDFTDIDSTVMNSKDIYYNRLLSNYIKDKNFKSQLKSRLHTNPYRSVLTQLLLRKINLEFPKNQIDFAVVTNKFIVFNSQQKADTIFSEKPIIGNILYGNLASLDNAFSVRNYVGTSIGTSNYKLLTEETLFVSVKNWEQIILQRMATILILSVVSILILITLFVIAIRALIKQKKVSDVKTDFINNITHELKTPLTTLSVSTKILERKEVQENPELFHSILETINRQNTRLQNLVDQVMSNSLGIEEIELQKEKVQPNLLVKTIISDFELAYPNVKIQPEIMQSEIILLLDKFHLTTAITNVLENAVKYGCQNISIKTTLENSIFTIGIQDDGIGIPKSKQPLLFEKFYRVEQGNLHNTKGLGLGLYYVDQILKAHKGSIKVVSDLGKGALFTISIPSV
ncbi:HAMP domain-containing sensor histidine kinase [Flavobacterium sp. SUN052]|uniref:sensor histidine kinase n=1 Tax=Flavobacterium sp. SUN052 TaxID=3002441 RepID=UPI00237D369C|nr:HAMP domain-containing sensor histidine kinase [Flavobacterium sp. SUN052]MEC4005211.1 HAMP domain-containing sensor histidine kinase [Flavobacterium sp. SUN052]